MLVPNLTLYLGVTPIVDTSKRTPCLCHTEAALPSILHSGCRLGELTVVLRHPSILVVLWRKNSSAAVEFPSPPSHQKQALLGCPDQTGSQCGAGLSLQTQGDLCIKDSPQGHPILEASLSSSSWEGKVTRNVYVFTYVSGSSNPCDLFVQFVSCYP